MSLENVFFNENGVSGGILRAEQGFWWDPEGPKGVFPGES